MAKQNRKITEEQRANKRIRQIAWTIVYVVAVFLLGVGSNYLKEEWNKANDSKLAGALYEQINPKNGYKLPVSYGVWVPAYLKVALSTTTHLRSSTRRAIIPCPQIR